VWLAPRSGWRRRYAGTAALVKLEVMDQLVRGIRGRRPPVRSAHRIQPVAANELTLREHYRRGLQRRLQGDFSLIDAALSQGFSLARPTRGSRSAVRAETCLRRMRTALVNMRATMSIDDYGARQLVQLAIERCHERIGGCAARRGSAGQRRRYCPPRASLRGGRIGFTFMRSLKILVVVHESLVPPARRRRLHAQQIDEWRTEYDVIRTLRLVGHEVRVQGVLDSLHRPAPGDHRMEAGRGLQPARGVRRHRHLRPACRRLPRAHAAALHRAAIPRGLLLLSDEPLLPSSCSPGTASRHRTSRCCRRAAKFRAPRQMRYPLFVKSATEDASLGIAQASVVETPQQLQDRVAFIHEQVGTDALVEEFIAGREVYVGVLGNERLTRLPVVGTAVRQHGGEPERHRHPQGQVGPLLPAAPRHHPRGGAGPASPRCSPSSTACPAASTARSASRATRAWTSASATTARCSCSRPTPTPASPRPRIFAVRAQRRDRLSRTCSNRIIAIGPCLQGRVARRLRLSRSQRSRGAVRERGLAAAA
jgi:hypothetical protein